MLPINDIVLMDVMDLKKEYKTSTITACEYGMVLFLKGDTKDVNWYYLDTAASIYSYLMSHNNEGLTLISPCNSYIRIKLSKKRPGMAKIRFDGPDPEREFNEFVTKAPKSKINNKKLKTTVPLYYIGALVNHDCYEYNC